MVTSVRTKRKKLNPEIVFHRDGKEDGVSKVQGKMMNTRIEKVSSDLVQESVESVKEESEAEVYPSSRENFSSLHSGEVKGIYRDNRMKGQVSSGVENRGVEHQKVTVETYKIREFEGLFGGKNP